MSQSAQKCPYPCSFADVTFSEPIIKEVYESLTHPRAELSQTLQNRDAPAYNDGNPLK